jgi:hypothetical protein
MRELKRFSLLAVGLMLLFAANASAGDFAGSSVVFDLDVDITDANEIMTNEGNADSSGLALSAGTGGRFEVEVFITPVPTTPLTSLAINFDIDTLVVELNRFRSESEDGWQDNTDPPGLIVLANTESSGLVEIAYGTGASLSDLDHFGFILPNGYAGTARFQPNRDIPDTEELKIGVTFAAFADTNSVGSSRDTLTVNPALTISSEQVELGGSATATLANYIAPFVINGTSDLIEWTVASIGAAGVDVEGQSGLVFSTGTDVTSIVINSSGSGAAAVDVSVAIGATNLAAPQVVFEEATPVELASFAGEVVEERVVLNWTTGSQTNNAGWRLLRSEDGENYEAVGEFVPGAGTTEELLSYTFDDAELPQSEIVFYVLEQIDLDGSVQLSNPIEVLLGARFQDIPQEFGVNSYPNPFNPSTTVSYDLPSAEQVTIVIYDVLGQEIRRLVDDQKAAGRYNIRWDARDNSGRSVGSGVYIAKIEAGAFSQSQKMLLLK